MTTPPIGSIGFSERILTTRQLGDLGEATVLQTIRLAQVGAGNFTVFTPVVGQLFLVYGGVIQNIHTAEITVKVQSAAVDIAEFKLGPRPTSPSDPANAGTLLMTPTGVPWFIGRAAAEALKIDTTHSILGFLLIGTRLV